MAALQQQLDRDGWFKLAHLSDPHLPLAETPRWHELLSKRWTGYLNWLRSRRHVHRWDVLNAICADVAQACPNHIVATGDFVQVAAEAEWPPVRLFLDSLGNPDSVTVIPGNHDAYTVDALPKLDQALSPNMRGDQPEPAGVWPFARKRGPVLLISCNSALPTPPFNATGELGNAQRERLATILAAHRTSPLHRVVLIHHPPIPGLASPRRALRDAQELQTILTTQGAELVLHGHNHTATNTVIAGTGTEIPIVGVPSASAHAHGRKPAAQWAEVRFPDTRGAAPIQIVRRGLSADGSLEVAEVERFEVGTASEGPAVQPLPMKSFGGARAGNAQS